MRYTVRISARAQRDLEEHRSYIALDAPGTADLFILRLVQAIDGLERFPARFPVEPAHSLFGRETRVRVVGNYRILYRVEGRIVRVLRVRHAARRRDEDVR